jgi:hypothetical protein
MFIPTNIVTKEQLLSTVGDFTWDFNQRFFVETSYGNFIWSDPDYNGDNSFVKTDLSINEFFSPYFGSCKGRHVISEYCGFGIELKEIAKGE